MRYIPASASPDEPTVNVTPHVASRLLVVFVVFRAFLGSQHHIALSAQRFSDAGKPCLFGGRQTTTMDRAPKLSSVLLPCLLTQCADRRSPDQNGRHRRRCHRDMNFSRRRNPKIIIIDARP